MSKKTILALLCLFPCASYSQVATPTIPKSYITAKEFSKDIALFRAKEYVVNNIFGPNKAAIQFEIDPLAAASSGELTSLVYRSTELSREGLILGFFGNERNAAGVVYQAYSFKNLPSAQAIELLNRIESVIKDNSKFLNSDSNSNNVYFTYDDLTFIISFDGQTNIRVFWNGFDASWDGTAFKRTKRRLLRKLD